jgi:membrane associated rhomboid family serine protease
MLLAQKASGESLVGVGGLAVPLGGDWWRLLSAPFAYVDVGYLFVVGIALAIFSVGVERRLGSVATAVLLLACGALGMLAAAGVAEARGDVVVVAGGNGMALGALAAWAVIRRAEARRSIDRDYDVIGVAVAAVALLLLPVFESSADVIAGIAGGAVGGLAGFAASALRRSE